MVDWSNDANDAQELWNDFEAKLVKVIDELAPVCEFLNGKLSSATNPFIKRKINIRKRLLKQLKLRPTLELKKRVKNLNVEIKNHFISDKKCNIRRKIIAGNSKSLWNAVKSAKDIGTSYLPASMSLAGRSVDEHERSDYFAAFFSDKVEKITRETIVDQNVYNGYRKLAADNQMFMSFSEVEK